MDWVKKMLVAAAVGSVAILPTMAGSVPQSMANGRIAAEPDEAAVVEVKKTDEAGNLLPGGEFQVIYCTRMDEDSKYDHCTDVPAAAQGLKDSGKGSVSDVVDFIGGGWVKPVIQCLGVRETKAPSGYVASPSAALVCLGPGGWTTENAWPNVILHGGGVFTPGLGDWKLTNVPNSSGSGTTTLTLVNKKVKPYIPPVFDLKKTDADGNLLPGGEFEVVDCTMPDEGSPWNCAEVTSLAQRLKDTGKASVTETVYVIGGWMPYVVQCLAIREVAPPSGYVASEPWAFICKGPGGWTAENAKGVSITFNGQELKAGLGEWAVTNVPNESDSGTTTLSLVNKPSPSPTPTESTTPEPTDPEEPTDSPSAPGDETSTSATANGKLPSTGSSVPGEAILLALVAVGAGISTLKRKR